MTTWQFRILWTVLSGRLRQQTAVRLHEDLALTRRSMEKLGARARLPANCRAEPVSSGPCTAER